VNIAVSQIASFSSDDSSDFRDKARTTVVETILSFLDFHGDLAPDFPHAGSTVSLKPASHSFPDPVTTCEVDHTQSFFPCSEEIARKIEPAEMARSLNYFFNEQMPEVLVHVVPNFFVMVMLSVKKRFSKLQIMNQISGTAGIPEPDLNRIMVAIESFLRTWVMNDFTITLGVGIDILGGRQGRQRLQFDRRFAQNVGHMWNGGGVRNRRGRRMPEGNVDDEKEETVECGHLTTLRSKWSSCAIAALEVCSVVSACQAFCLVQGPFSRRILHVDQIKVAQANRSPLCASVASARAFLLQSNMVSSLASAVTQRCLLLLPAQTKARIGQHLQSLAEKSVCALALSCGLEASRYGVQLAAEVQLFEHQVTQDALTAALNLASSTVLSHVSFSSRIPSSSAKIYVVARLLYGFDHLDRNEFQGSSNALINVFTGLQIIKKFLFQAFSQVNI
jgi:hypothetical protein